MKRLYLSLLLFLPISLCGQNGQQQEFDDFLRQAQSEFESYEKQINYEFAETLRNQWEEFQVFKGEDVPVRPKPVAPLAVTPDTDMTPYVIQGTPVPEENSLMAISGHITIRVVRKCIEWKGKTLSEEDRMNARKAIGNYADKSRVMPKPLKKMLTFYNVPVSIDVPAEYTEYKMKGNSEGDVADFWSYLTASEFEYVVSQVAKDADAKGLENWGLFRYIETISENVFPSTKADEKNVFTAFIANQLGLDVKVGRTNENLVTMVAIAQQVYEWMSIRIGNRKYYFRHGDEDLKSLYSYSTPFIQETAQINLLKSMPDHLSPPAKIQTRVLRSTAFDCEISVPLDTNLCHYISDFPKVRCDIPAMTDVGEEFAKSIYDAIYPKIQDKSQYEAVSILMKFMHNDFEYATDQDQFGYEKPFFCEENFLYPYNDCEDRSILFSYLVRHLLGMDVILLDYPGHITTAIAFDEDINGSYLEFEDKKYFVCDPTYLDSRPGMAHYSYKNIGCNILKI